METSIFTEITVTGLTVYGLLWLFVKALLLLLLAQTLTDQFEFSSATLLHSIWLLAVIGLALLPVFTLMLPSWHVISVALPGNPPEGVGTVVDVIAAPVQAPLLSPADYAVIAYLAVAIVRSAMLVADILRVAIVTIKASNAGPEWYQQLGDYTDKTIAIRVTACLDSPVTWGVLRPVILLPADCERWSAREREMVLRHELEHICRADWLILLVAHWVAILYWPVPGMARALRLLSLEAERACDNRVIIDGVAQADYAGLLLKQARVNRLKATVALGKPSQLVERVKHIVSAYVDRSGERRARRWLALLVTGLVVPLASVQVAGERNETDELAGMSLMRIELAASPAQKPAPKVSVDTLPVTRPPRPSFDHQAPQVSTENPAQNIAYVVTTPNDPDPVPEVVVLNTTVLSQKSSAKLLRRATPEYPRRAIQRGIEGRVVVEFDIDSTGKVVNPRIIQSPATRLFNRPVLDAVKRFQYQPYQLGDQSVGFSGVREEFRFQLVDDPPGIDSG